MPPFRIAALQEAATPMPPIPTTETVYVTSAYIASLGLSGATQQTANDADAVYLQIQSSPWIAQTDLVTWAASNLRDDPTNGAVDRLNAALALLSQAQLIATIG